jgi:hypothetical protein
MMASSLRYGAAFKVAPLAAVPRLQGPVCT